MARIYKNGNVIDSKLVEFIADTEAEIAELPTNVGSGSLCLVLQSASGGATVYMLGQDGQWHEL